MTPGPSARRKLASASILVLMSAALTRSITGRSVGPPRSLVSGRNPGKGAVEDAAVTGPRPQQDIVKFLEANGSAFSLIGLRSGPVALSERRAASAAKAPHGRSESAKDVSPVAERYKQEQWSRPSTATGASRASASQSRPRTAGERGAGGTGEGHAAIPLKLSHLGNTLLLAATLDYKPVLSGGRGDFADCDSAAATLPRQRPMTAPSGARKRPSAPQQELEQPTGGRPQERSPRVKWFDGSQRPASAVAAPAQAVVAPAPAAPRSRPHTAAPQRRGLPRHLAAPPRAAYEPPVRAGAGNKYNPDDSSAHLREYASLAGPGAPIHPSVWGGVLPFDARALAARCPWSHFPPARAKELERRARLGGAGTRGQAGAGTADGAAARERGAAASQAPRGGPSGDRRAGQLSRGAPVRRHGGGQLGASHALAVEVDTCLDTELTNISLDDRRLTRPTREELRGALSRTI